MVDELVIRKMASSAKIFLRDSEIEEMQKAMTQMLEIAESISAAETAAAEAAAVTAAAATATATDAAATAATAETEAATETYDVLAITVKSLREDKLMTKNINIVTSTELIDQSPTANDNGYTIPRLME